MSLIPTYLDPRYQKQDNKAHNHYHLQQLFDDCFLKEFNTRLLGGKDEPIYLPSSATGRTHIIYYREDFFASALHEIAHWCIAGSQRRKLLDYGYWYIPDGRNYAQQQAFELAEVKPQAIEYAFSLACGKFFQTSSDNITNDAIELEHNASEYPQKIEFSQKVEQQLGIYLERGFPSRAKTFLAKLTEFYAISSPFEQAQL